MKYIFLFLPFFAGAQEVTKDTSWILNLSGAFYNVSRVEYDNGTYTESSSMVGDTAALLSYYTNYIATQARQYSSAAIVAMKAQSATTFLARIDTLTNQRISQSPITAIMASYERDFLTGNWELQYSGTTTAVTFPRLSSNQRIRILPAGGQARTMLIFGDMMRVVNYPVQGNNTLFKVRNGRWENLTRTIVLRRIITR